MGVAPPGRVEGGLGSCRTPGGTRQDSPAGIAWLRGEAIMTFARSPATAGEGVSYGPSSSPRRSSAARRCRITNTIPWGAGIRAVSRAQAVPELLAPALERPQAVRGTSRSQSVCRPRAVRGTYHPAELPTSGKRERPKATGWGARPWTVGTSPHRAALRPLHDQDRHAGALGEYRHGAIRPGPATRLRTTSSGSCSRMRGNRRGHGDPRHVRL